MRKETSRQGWADLLRCFATVMVVLLHVSGAHIGTAVPGTRRFLAANMMDGITRWTVPCFVMLSGTFLLDPKRELSKKTWLRHIARIGACLALWGYLYAVWLARGSHRGAERILEGLISFVSGRLVYHFWFLPMLLGLYLLTPLFRAMVKGASRSTLWYAVGLWFAATSLWGTVNAMAPAEPALKWFTLGGLESLGGYGGYYLLGYLLRTCKPRPWAERTLYGLGAAGLAVTVWGTQVRSVAAGVLYTGWYGNFTPNVFFTAAAVFLLFRRLDLGKSPVWSKLSSLTFGVYIFHPFFLVFLQERLNFPHPGWGLLVSVPLQVAVAVLCSAAAAWVVRHIPKAGHFIA